MGDFVFIIYVSVCRPSHDISLEEFDDEDLSEITDDCGIGLNYDSDPYEKVWTIHNASFLFYFIYSMSILSSSLVWYPPWHCKH